MTIQDLKKQHNENFVYVVTTLHDAVDDLIGLFLEEDIRTREQFALELREVFSGLCRGSDVLKQIVNSAWEGAIGK